MQFDYSEKIWTVGGYNYTSPQEIGSWELALYREKLQAETIKSPFGKSLPAIGSPKRDKAISDAMLLYSNKHSKFAALIACEAILTPAPGSPPFEDAVKGLSLVEVTTELAPLITFFFESAKSNIPSAPVSLKSGKTSKGTRKGNPSKTTSR